MAGNSQGTPDLAEILRSLQAYQPPQQNGHPNSGYSGVYQQQNQAYMSAGVLTPNSHGPQLYGQGTPSSHLSGQHLQPGDPRLAAQRRMSPPTSRSHTPIVDPATITEWAQGLRCVTKVSAQNPNFGAKIRQMIDNQGKHERMWWNAREDVAKKKAAQVKEGASKEVINESAAELQAYDRKVHKAQQEMVAAMSKELKTLGVPFFGVPLYLVKKSMEEASGTAGVVPDAARISEEELLGLQRRMIQYLEDMYRD